jgi:triosephosphate isomerase (TIM)
VRKALIAGNWKMNLDAARARRLIEELRAALDPERAALARDREVMVAPPAVLIPDCAAALKGGSIALGAQNMHQADSGAFTGEVSAPMLKPFGVSYVILGHSERRHVFGESDPTINLKMRAAARHAMTPILCVGETAEQRDAGRTLEVVLDQLTAGLEGIEPAQGAGVVVAYEPVWAIGTGRNATPEQANEVHGAIREALRDAYGAQAAGEIRILYGGSVSPDNVDSLLSRPDIDGALVGGASLKADSFVRIVRARLG